MPAYAQADAEPGEECVTDTNVAGVIGADGDCIPTGDGPTGVTTDKDVEIATGSSGETGSKITVTGSRIVRDTYSSISPLQVISTENQQAIGAFDPSQILQRSEVAAGVQIDATFNGFVLDNGPGSQTINLRGLGANRTLVLVNGRRLAPAGVEGAPVNPSINLIPASLIDRFDILTDGASSIYGSDAVAGVVNAILRKDFDGLELQVNGNVNPGGEGEDYSISGAWGFTTDRGVFGIGAEYRFVEEFRRGDRDFLRGCTTNLEIDEQGNRFRVDRRSNALVQDLTGGALTVRESECAVTRQAGFLNTRGMRAGSIFAPNNGNIANFPNDPITGNPFPFGDSQDAFQVQQDRNNDGIRDVDFQNINTNDAPEQLLQTIIPEQEVINIFTYGEYTFPGEANITPFFEAQYTRSEVNQRGAGNPQLFPWVPGFNQFNPCNFVSNPNGVDCRAVDNEFNQLNPGQANEGLLPPLSTGLQLAILPVAAIRGDRNNFEVTQEQYRGVLGVRGDLPFLGSSWRFEASGTYSRSEGFSTRRGIRFDRLALSLGIDPTADFNFDGVVDNNGNGIADDISNIPIDSATSPAVQALFIGECNAAGLSNPGLAAPDLNADQCSPVNLFAPEVLTGAVGDLPQNQRDYLFGERDVNTIYEQTLLQAFVSGDLFELPAGPVGVSLGVEWREDAINTQPGIEASDGLFFGFTADEGARGSAWIRELFGEIDIPLIAGETLVEELNVNLSGRLTEQEFYGTNGTFAIKGGWRPVSPLLLRLTYGTSFRAPNLRENFLAGQSGFNNGLFDPCAVPADAFIPGQGGYVAELDERQPFVLENCRREGRDPTRAGIDEEGLGTVQVTSAEVTTGGTFDIDPETSTSLTAGFSFEESFPSGFDVAMSLNYYDIQLEDTIIEPGSQFIVNDCFLRDDGVRSDFCDRISVDTQGRQLVNAIQAGFLNRDSEAVRGIDINATFGKDVTIGGELFDLRLEVIANHLITRELRELDDVGNVNVTELANNFGFPDWTGRATFNIDWKDFRFTYQIRYVDYMQSDGVIGNPAEDIEGLPFTDAFGFTADGEGGNRISPTCLGLDSPNGVVPGEGNFCRPVGFTPEWFEHTASLRWDNGDFRIIGGVTNLFDTPPPLVSPAGGVTQISNVPLGLPFNLDGREFFVQLLYRF
jgi:iron complex outermembrane receptor protein